MSPGGTRLVAVMVRHWEASWRTSLVLVKTSWLCTGCCASLSPQRQSRAGTGNGRCIGAITWMNGLPELMGLRASRDGTGDEDDKEQNSSRRA
ncbi:hypothetical protein BJY00DRAFT_275668 [Aspergillus carlsbadensis]|nr:hypothetical protein BJY00DRAFT_275668 [Aspergillus carlsbadensis]